MKRKILLKVLILLLALVMIVNNFSYASDVTLEKLKSSLEYVFSQDIVVKGEYDGGTTSSTTGGYEDISITDSKINIEGIDLNYTLADNVCKFNFDYTMENKEDEETAFMLMGILLGQVDCMQREFLATANAVGIDLSLAYNYFSQQTNDEFATDDSDGAEDLEDTSVTINNEIFDYIIDVNGEEKFSIKSSLQIRLDKLATLNESQIDKSKEVYTITLQEPSDEEKIDLTNEKLKEALEYIFSRDINATENDANGVVTETTLSLSDNKIKIDDSNINIDGKDIIKYESFGTVCNFDIEYTAKDEDEASLIAFEQFELMMRCYLATAKGIDTDISLAYTDFQQVIDKMLGENIELEDFTKGALVENKDRFIYFLDVSEDGDGTYTINVSLTVDLNELASLTKDKIDSSSTMYTVTLENPSTESEITDDGEDDTIVKGEIPYTGASYTIIVAIITILAIGIFAKVKYNSLKDIK